MFFGNFSDFGKKVKLDNNVHSVTKSQVSVMSDQWRASLHMVMLQNIMQHSEEGDFILFNKIPVSSKFLIDDFKRYP